MLSVVSSHLNDNNVLVWMQKALVHFTAVPLLLLQTIKINENIIDNSQIRYFICQK